MGKFVLGSQVINLPLQSKFEAETTRRFEEAYEQRFGQALQKKKEKIVINIEALSEM